MKLKLYLPLALLLLPSCFWERDKGVIDKKPLKDENTMITTSSGLRYVILQQAPVSDAPEPRKGKAVKVHYTGWLADKDGNPLLNSKFDSSVDRNAPFTFTLGVGQVIKGWDEGVMSMKVGEKRRLVIPSELAYGARGAGLKIPPHASLVFDVELLGVE